MTAALDSDQQEAVAHRDGPCLVLAGPGSGKTRVIVARYAALVEEGVRPDEQLVLTYTRKAADEMRSRADHVVGPLEVEPPLTNYHAFAYGIVRQWGWLSGISPVFRIADAAERWLHVEAVLAELRPRTLWNPLRPHDLMEPLLQLIGYAKQELVTPAAYASWAAEAIARCTDPAERALLSRHEEVAAVYAALDQRYRRFGVFDHDDCILHAERLLDAHPVVRRAVADRIRYVMVDEYQDTNFAQARLVETLARDHRNLFVVADDDQSIYKFRGASRANLDRFTRQFPEHRSVVLTRNYRSTDEIVDASRRVIAEATAVTRIEKHLTAVRGAGAPVEIWAATDERDEVVAVASECRRLIDAGAPPAQIAWLFRRHVDMLPAMRALRELGVPYQVSGGRGFFKEREIKDLFALLMAAADPEDSQAVLRCLHMPAWRVSPHGRARLAVLAREHDQPLAALLGETTVPELDEQDAQSVRACIDDVHELHAMTQREDVREVFFAALERSRYLGLLDDEEGAARLQVAANLNKFGELLESFADWSDDRRVSTALRYLEILRDSSEADELAPIESIETGIVLSTAHGAKGLEWETVFLGRCVGDEWNGRQPAAHELRLPDELVPEPPPLGDAAVDEERRLFYVAATRARNRLVFTWAQRYTARSYRPERRTPFLDVLDERDDVLMRRLEHAGVPLTAARRRAGQPLPEDLRLGVSDLRVFRSCPRRFEYRRIWRLPTRDGVQSWYGTLMHDVLRIAAAKRAAGELIDADAVAGLWQTAWDASRGPKGVHPELRSMGEEQLRRYVVSPAWASATIESVEQGVVLQLGAAQLSGRFDRVDTREDESGTRRVVVDYKTSRPKHHDIVQRDLQVRAYAVALSRREHVDNARVELHYLQTGEVTAVDFDRAFLSRAEYQLGAVTDELVQAWAGGTFPARPSRWQCGRCEYRTVCDESRSPTDG